MKINDYIQQAQNTAKISFPDLEFGEDSSVRLSTLNSDVEVLLECQWISGMPRILQGKDQLFIRINNNTIVGYHARQGSEIQRSDLHGNTYKKRMILAPEVREALQKYMWDNEYTVYFNFPVEDVLTTLVPYLKEQREPPEVINSVKQLAFQMILEKPRNFYMFEYAGRGDCAIHYIDSSTSRVNPPKPLGSIEEVSLESKTFPVQFNVLDGKCQKGCVHCILSFMTQSNPTYVTLSQTQAFINLNKGFDYSINLSLYGEATLNPEFFDICKLFIENNIPITYLPTNLGIPLNIEQLEILSRIEVIDLDISPDVVLNSKSLEYTKENYYKLRDYLASLPNSRAKTILKTKTVYNGSSPGIELIPDVDPTFHEVISMAVFAEKFFAGWLSPEDNAVEKYADYLSHLKLSPKDYKKGLAAKMIDGPDGEKCYCHHPQTLRITSSHTATFCMMARELYNAKSKQFEFPDETSIGNPFQTSLRELIYSNRAIEAILQQKDIMFDLCQRCPCCTPLKRKHTFFPLHLNILGGTLEWTDAQLYQFNNPTEKIPQ